MFRVLLIIERSSEYGRLLLQGIKSYSDIHGPWLFYPFFDGKHISLAQIQKCNPNGLIMVEPKECKEIRETGLPMVVSPCHEEPYPDLVNIIGNNIAAGAIAAEHLINNGLWNFAFCGYDEDFLKRKEGFCSRIAKAGFKNYIYKQPPRKYRSWVDEQGFVVDWLKSLPKPVGVLACSDIRAQQVSESCKIAGLHVPQQVSLIGVDNDPLICALSSPSLSSVEWDFVNVGFRAAESLHMQMAGKRGAHSNIVCEPLRVAARQSSDCLAIKDSNVAAAIHYIRTCSDRILQVSDVVNHVSVPRRNLERLFKQALGRCIATEIQQIRLQRVCEMLVKTNLPLSEVAERTGFSGSTHLGVAFKKAMKMTPLTYRKQYQDSRVR